MKIFETKASLTSKGTMTLTKTKILDTMCPTCKAKEGEECSISGDVMMVKQFQDIIPGVQSEQLVIILIDRHKKLNSRFPSPQNEKMLLGLQMFLDACKERVDERIKNGVMGQLKN